GALLGIIGQICAGKVTLLRTLAGLLAPSHGEVLADGRPLLRMRPRERAAHVAVVTQDAPLMSGPSVRDLVLMGRYAHRRRLAPPTPADHPAVDRGLRDAGAAAFADR